MVLDESSLLQEIQAVIDTGRKDVHYYVMCLFYVDGLVIEPLKVVDMYILQDYTENVGDQGYVTLYFRYSDYIEKILPYRDRLSIEFTYIPRYEDTNQEDREQVGLSRYTRHYHAVLTKDEDPILEGNLPGIQNPQTYDLAQLKPVRVEFLHAAVDRLRISTVGGTHRRRAPYEVLHALLTQKATSLPLEEKYRLKGVDIVSPDNTRRYEHVIIPHGTPLLHLHRFLQDQGHGIYQHDIASYIQNDLWYVFSPYKTNRYYVEREAVTIFNVPPNRFPMMERTYRQDDHGLTVLSTGKVYLFDDSETQRINQGSGTLFMNAEKIMETFGEHGPNQSYIDRTQHIQRYVGYQRPDGLGHTPVSTERITSNFYTQASKVARRQGKHIVVTWQQSHPFLIYPGMPCRFVHLGKGKDVVKEIYGIVIKAEHDMQLAQKGLLSRRHVFQTTLVLFVQA